MSGPSSPYDDADEVALFQWFDDSWEEEAAGTPTTMRVTAQVEWAGVLDRTRGGVRTVNLDGLDLTAVLDALTAARKATSAESTAGSSLTAKGWHAQLGELLKNPRGMPASERAQLAPSARTVLAWLAGDRAPSKANQGRIDTAYRDVRNQLVREGRQRAGQARHELADALNRSLTDRYGSEIRLRDISYLSLG